MDCRRQLVQVNITTLPSIVIGIMPKVILTINAKLLSMELDINHRAVSTLH
jgi:hypothetical protein